MDKFKERIEGWKRLAEILILEGKNVFIKDNNGNLYFAKIASKEDSKLFVDCFGPKQRAGQKCPIYWVAITHFDEYRGAA